MYWPLVANYNKFYLHVRHRDMSVRGYTECRHLIYEIIAIQMNVIILPKSNSDANWRFSVSCADASGPFGFKYLTFPQHNGYAMIGDDDSTETDHCQTLSSLNVCTAWYTVASRID